MRLSVCLLLFLATTVGANDGAVDITGHTKIRFVGTAFPSDSVLRDLAGSNSLDLEGDLRLNFEASRGGWSFDTAYQLVGFYGDRVEYTRDLPPATELFFPRFPDDIRRALDLTKILHDRGKAAVLHRLDRLWLGYATEKTVVRLGRQAITWGNGLFYAPMDLVNPFDPATIDTEYKAGDDMLYLQYLQDNGNDVQAAAVARRNVLSGEVESEEATVTVKYHGFAGETEFDLLVQVVANWTWSWTWGGRNVSGAFEYHFNGFGQDDGRYDPASLAGNPDLLLRVARNELFTLGRHYAAGSLMIEMTPLWTLTPTLLANVADPSALLQFVTSLSLSDDLTFLGSLNLPVGPSGSEFGGIDSGSDGRYLSTGAGVFAQIAWYF
jgi:hypothetical protein